MIEKFSGMGIYHRRMKKRQELTNSILLCGKSDGKIFTRTFYIVKTLEHGSGASAICYEAYHEGSGRGVLKEFYPQDAYYLERNNEGQLTFLPMYRESCEHEHFIKAEEEYIKSHEMLLNIKRDNHVLATFIPIFEIYHGCEAGNVTGTTYVWTPEPKLETFAEMCENIHNNPSSNPERKLITVLQAVNSLTKCVCALHTAEMIHRDIKPSNFGFVKRGDETLTQALSMYDINTLCSVYANTNERIGTNGFVEPEAGYESADNQTDIYSIGASLFYAIIITDEVKEHSHTYKREYYDRLETMVDESALIRSSKATSLPQLKKILVKILQKCLCERAFRYDDCEELIKDLDEALYYALPLGLGSKRESDERWVLESAQMTLRPSTTMELKNDVGVYETIGTMQLYGVQVTQGNIKDCKFNSACTAFLAYDDANTVYVWDDNSGKLLYKEAFNHQIRGVEFTDDNSICVVTRCEAKNIHYADGGVKWYVSCTDTSYDCFDGMVLFSLDSTILALTKCIRWLTEDIDSYFDQSINVLFINTQSGEILYNASVPVDEQKHLSIVCADFVDSSFVVSYNTYLGNNSSTKFICFNLTDGSYDKVPYETEVTVCAMQYCSNKGFAYVGYDHELRTIVQGVTLDGTEWISTVIEDVIVFGSTEIDFHSVGWEDIDLHLFTLYIDNELIFIDMITGTTYYKARFKGIKNIYPTSVSGRLLILCADGVYHFDTAQRKCAKLYSFNQACKYFIWGNTDKYAAVGADKFSIWFYRQREDFVGFARYLSTDSMGFSRYLSTGGIRESKTGKFFTYHNYNDGNIYVYDSLTKKEMSVIPGYFKPKILNNAIIYIKDNILYVYDTYTGDLIYSLDFDKKFNKYIASSDLQISGDEKKMIIRCNSAFFEIGGKNSGIDAGEYAAFIHNWRLNNDGNIIVADIFNETYDMHNLLVMNANTGETTIIEAESAEELISYDKEPAFSDTNLAAVKYDGSIMVIDLNDRCEKLRIDNVNALQMAFTPDSKSLVVYNADNILYKIDIKVGAATTLPLPLTSEESDNNGLSLTMNTQRNEVIVSRKLAAYFIDLDTFEVCAAMEHGLYSGFLNSTQEIITSSTPAKFYSYYTSEQLIEIINNM